MGLLNGSNESAQSNINGVPNGPKVAINTYEIAGVSITFTSFREKKIEKARSCGEVGH